MRASAGFTMHTLCAVMWKILLGGQEARMKQRIVLFGAFLILATTASAQIGKSVSVAAGTPEDKDLEAIYAAPDGPDKSHSSINSRPTTARAILLCLAISSMRKPTSRKRITRRFTSTATKHWHSIPTISPL